MTEIQNAAALIDLFGHWPDFHDGEIHAMRLDMTDHSEPSLEIAFEVTEMSNAIDDRGESHELRLNSTSGGVTFCNLLPICVGFRRHGTRPSALHVTMLVRL